MRTLAFNLLLHSFLFISFYWAMSFYFDDGMFPQGFESASIENSNDVEQVLPLQADGPVDDEWIYQANEFEFERFVEETAIDIDTDEKEECPENTIEPTKPANLFKNITDITGAITLKSKKMKKYRDIYRCSTNITKTELNRMEQIKTKNKNKKRSKEEMSDSDGEQKERPNKRQWCEHQNVWTSEVPEKWNTLRAQSNPSGASLCYAQFDQNILSNLQWDPINYYHYMLSDNICLQLADQINIRANEHTGKERKTECQYYFELETDEDRKTSIELLRTALILRYKMGIDGNSQTDHRVWWDPQVGDPNFIHAMSLDQYEWIMLNLSFCDSSIVPGYGEDGYVPFNNLEPTASALRTRSLSLVSHHGDLNHIDDTLVGTFQRSQFRQYEQNKPGKRTGLKIVTSCINTEKRSGFVVDWRLLRGKFTFVEDAPPGLRPPTDYLTKEKRTTTDETYFRKRGNVIFQLIQNSPARCFTFDREFASLELVTWASKASVLFF